MFVSLLTRLISLANTSIQADWKRKSNLSAETLSFLLKSKIPLLKISWYNCIFWNSYAKKWVNIKIFLTSHSDWELKSGYNAVSAKEKDLYSKGTYLEVVFSTWYHQVARFNFVRNIMAFIKSCIQFLLAKWVILFWNYLFSFLKSCNCEHALKLSTSKAILCLQLTLSQPEGTNHIWGAI